MVCFLTLHLDIDFHAFKLLCGYISPRSNSFQNGVRIGNVNFAYFKLKLLMKDIV